jgi:hypothetical protein
MLLFCKYLLAAKNPGIIYDPKRDKSIEVYADANFYADWNNAFITAPDCGSPSCRLGLH